MKVISQREFAKNPTEVIEAVEAGEACQVVRDGAEVAELRPPTHRQRLKTDEVIDIVGDLPEVDYAQMRAEADEFFGNVPRSCATTRCPSTGGRRPGTAVWPG